MNYKDIITNHFQKKADSKLIVFALVAGIAAGAAVAALFARRPGKETRKLIADKINGRLEEAQPIGIKDHLIDDIRESTRDHAEKLQGRANKNISTDPIAIKVSSAGTAAWKESSTQKKEKQPWKE